MDNPKNEAIVFPGGWPFPWFGPRFDWIQVEVTSDCTAACRYCPRTAYRNLWQDRYLPLDSFRRLQPAFARAQMVHLQGWGEPFLHPDFFAMAALARDAGCRVGTTTNGMLLNPERIASLVAAGLDVVAFSLAGTDIHNDAVRRGTRLEQVLETIRALDREKRRVDSRKPALHVAYMLLRSGIKDVEALPSLLGGLGLSQVVVSTLDFVPAAELESEALRPATTGEYEDLENLLQQVVRSGARSGLPIHYHLPRLQRKRSECTENIHRGLCVASDGSVTPCVFTNLLIPGGRYLRQGQERPYERLVFGNINQESLKDIWRKKNYRLFRRSFSRGSLLPSCEGCAKF
jgi:MoaA/NifB/PqqE/SkfB family radical SAM enzyme